MPLDASAFPEEVQVAFFMYSVISDNWDGMSGTYMGKNWEELPYVFKLYGIDNEKVTFYFLQLYDNEVIKYRAEAQEKKRKAEERKRQQASGKTYTHNVKG